MKTRAYSAVRRTMLLTCIKQYGRIFDEHTADYDVYVSCETRVESFVIFSEQSFNFRYFIGLIT